MVSDVGWNQFLGMMFFLRFCTSENKNIKSAKPRICTEPLEGLVNVYI